jgi:hypothetical protein
MDHLRDGAKQVRDLFSELQTYSLVRPDWKEEVYAPRSLGDNDTKVELWYLAGHFLLAWHDWHRLRSRYRGYFGIEDHETPFPSTWKRLDERCIDLALELLHSNDLDQLHVEDWLMSGVIHAEDDTVPPLRDAVHVVIQNHRRWHLMRNSVAGYFTRLREPAEVQVQREFGWFRCLKLVRRLNDETYPVCRRIDEALDGALCHHLRRYCAANLLFSWLDQADDESEGGGSRSVSGSGNYSRFRSGSGSTSYPRLRSGSGPPDEDIEIGESALIRLLSERIVIPSIDQYLSQLEDANTRGTVRHMVERIIGAIGEGSFDDFVDDVASGELRGGPESLVGVSAINLIPSETRGPCHAVLLAISKGDKKAIGFTNVMREVRTHLVNCPQTKAVVILCDFWTPAMLDEHLGDLRAHHKRGVRFLFLMAGIPRRTVSPVAVDLGMTP